MERCPECKNRGGLEYGCIEDGCDIYLFSDDIRKEDCRGEGCWHCVDCDTTDLGFEDVATDEYSDVFDAYDVDDYVFTDNMNWVED